MITSVAVLCVVSSLLPMPIRDRCTRRDGRHALWPRDSEDEGHPYDVDRAPALGLH